MSINYTYEIVSVDAAARCMEVAYSAPGHPTVHVGVRIPYEGEALEAVVDVFAPVAYWEEQQRPVAQVSVGAKGTIARTAVEPIWTMTPLQFMERFTEAEQLAITTAAQSTPSVRMWYDRLIAASEVVQNDPRLQAGMSAMVAAGLLTQARADAIMDWSQPSAGGGAAG